MELSVCIPYKARLDNLGIALEARGEVGLGRVGPRIARLPAAYRDAVLAEAGRVSRRMVVDDSVVVDEDRL